MASLPWAFLSQFPAWPGGGTLTCSLFKLSARAEGTSGGAFRSLKFKESLSSPGATRLLCLAVDCDRWRLFTLGAIGSAYHDRECLLWALSGARALPSSVRRERRREGEEEPPLHAPFHRRYPGSKGSSCRQNGSISTQRASVTASFVPLCSSQKDQFLDHYSFPHYYQWPETVQISLGEGHTATE